jgi:hypothetical protein
LKVFFATVAVTLLLLWPFSMLFDTDGYFHLAAAARYLAGGWRGGLEWARLSAMADGFGDKEFLFHVLLVPFVAVSRSALAGKLALAVLNAILAAGLARLFAPLLGGASAFVHLGLALGALDYAGRLLRLRPELLSLSILLLSLWLAATGRHRTLGAVAVIYALSYSGFHVLPLLCLVWFAWEMAVRRRRVWPLLLWPVLGTIAGVVLHPQFPANVRIWVLQSVLRYLVDLPDAGAEMTAGFSLTSALVYNSGWLLGLVVLWRSGRPVEAGSREDDARLREYAILATAVFFAFYLLLPLRFGLYLVPLGTWSLLLEMRRRGMRVSPRVRLLGGRSTSVWIALGACLALGSVGVRSLALNMKGSDCFRPARLDHAREFGDAVPSKARVAATWADAESYTFWAPQGRYLNVLDPVFMAVPHVDAYRASLSVFEGDQPDVPLVVGTALRSDYLAFSVAFHQDLLERVTADPRLRRLYAADDVLLVLVPGANGVFALDWRIAPAGTPGAAVTGSSLPRWPAYPRFGEERGASLEGFVDLRRLGPGPACRVFAKTLEAPSAATIVWELSSWGAARLWLDGQLVVGSLAGTRAVLGQGVLAEVRLGAGPHVVAIESCAAEGVGGFYLVERDRQIDLPSA